MLAQVGHREQVLEGFGWTMLPGLYPTGKSLELDVSYKASCLAARPKAHSPGCQHIP